MIGEPEGTAVDEAEGAAPLPNGDNGLVEGRDNKGRFVKGNRGGPGNPQARNVSNWRRALADTVSNADVKKVAKELTKAAKGGEPWAIRELLDRCLGKPQVQIALEVETEAVRELTESQASDANMITRLLLMDRDELNRLLAEPGGAPEAVPAVEPVTL